MSNGEIVGIPIWVNQKTIKGVANIYILKIYASNYKIATASMYGGNCIDYVGNLSKC